MTVLVNAAARYSDGANNFAICDNGNPALVWDSPSEAEDAKPVPSRRNRILKELGRTAKQGGSASLLYREVYASRLGVLHLLEVDELATGIDDRDCHCPAAPARLSNRGCRRGLRNVRRDCQAIRDLRRWRERSLRDDP